jgi:hypothetical protein
LLSPFQQTPPLSTAAGGSVGGEGGRGCSTWLRTEVEYQLESNVIHLFPEKHNHQKLLLYHNIDRAQSYR